MQLNMSMWQQTPWLNPLLTPENPVLMVAERLLMIYLADDIPRLLREVTALGVLAPVIVAHMALQLERMDQPRSDFFMAFMLSNSINLNPTIKDIEAFRRLLATDT